jgi:hypothetical protein
MSRVTRLKWRELILTFFTCYLWLHNCQEKDIDQWIYSTKIIIPYTLYSYCHRCKYCLKIFGSGFQDSAGALTCVREIFDSECAGALLSCTNVCKCIILLTFFGVQETQQHLLSFVLASAVLHLLVTSCNATHRTTSQEQKIHVYLANVDYMKSTTTPQCAVTSLFDVRYTNAPYNQTTPTHRRRCTQLIAISANHHITVVVVLFI